MSAEILTSTANPRVKAAAALRSRRERDRTGRFLVDGTRELGRALDAGWEIERIFACDELCGLGPARELLDRLGAGDPRVVRVSAGVFERLAFGDRTDGLLGVAVRRSTALADLRLPARPLVVVIEALEKPGNLGAILRTADGAGADAVVAADPHGDLFNPNAVRASMGTIFSVPLAQASSEATLSWLREIGLTIAVARVDGAVAWSEADLRGPLAIVLGSEAHGLSEAWRGPDVIGVRLPMMGMADSLNVASAAAILLYEARRQRDSPA